MAAIRLIARLDVKGPNLIKGVHLEGLRKLGDPRAFAQEYYAEGVDEILYMDVVASLYGRNSLTDVVERTAENVFVPITVGGGIRSVDDARKLLRAGADKVAVNTAAVQRPQLIAELADHFGSQCVVLSIEAKQRPGGWEAYTDNGRERTGLDVVAWAHEGARLGAGEILLTSVDREGTGKGLDLALVQAVNGAVTIPVIASGGIGNARHVTEAIQAGADAVAMAQTLHYKKLSLAGLRDSVSGDGLVLCPH